MPEQCPVSGQLVDERTVRLTACGVLLVLSAFFLSAWWPLAAFLTADFFVRTLGQGRYSLLFNWSRWVRRLSSAPPSLVDAAPKRFAAGIGWGLSLAALFLCLAGYATAARITAVVIMACAALEAFAGVCLGCKAYSLLFKIK